MWTTTGHAIRALAVIALGLTGAQAATDIPLNNASLEAGGSTWGIPNDFDGWSEGGPTGKAPVARTGSYGLWNCWGNGWNSLSQQSGYAVGSAGETIAASVWAKTDANLGSGTVSFNLTLKLGNVGVAFVQPGYQGGQDWTKLTTSYVTTVADIGKTVGISFGTNGGPGGGNPGYVYMDDPSLSTTAPSLQLAPPRLTSGNAVELQLTGPVDQIIEIQSSSDLQAWSSRAFLPNPTGTRTWEDASAASAIHRFYRARNVPPVVLFAQPSITSANQFQGILVTGGSPGGFVLRWPYPSPVSIGWDVGAFTGFHLDAALRSQYQWAANTSANATAVQGYGDTLGLWLNTASAGFTGELLPMTPVYDWSGSEQVLPFQTAGRELSFSFELQVPTAERQGQAEVYVNAYFLFRNARTNLQFWYGAAVFDLRGTPSEYVKVDDWEGGTGLAILNSVLADGGSFSHRGPGSASFQARTWPAFRYFDFRISEAEFQAGLGMLAQQSSAFVGTSPQEYLLTHVNLNPEAYISKTAGTGNEARLGLAVRKMKVSLVAPIPADPEPGFYRVLVNAANGTGSDQSLQVFFKTEASNFYSEDKSQTVTLPAGGGYWELAVDFYNNSRYRGTITGLRIDPLMTNGSFGIDYVRVANTSGQFIQQWEFNGQTSMTNPYFGWTLANITGRWTDGARWGGQGAANKDPQFAININYGSGR